MIAAVTASCAPVGKSIRLKTCTINIILYSCILVKNVPRLCCC